MKHSSPSLRFCAALLALSIAWFLCGAPLLPGEWQEVPARLMRTLRQLPGRTTIVWRNWLSGGMGIPSALAETRTVDLPLRIWDAEAQAAFTLPLEAYIEGVVAAEMPAGNHPEALKCQAVAARTRAAYACRELGGNGCASHPGCDLCTASACCQGYLSPQARTARWGSEAAMLAQRVTSAVRATAGQLLTYNGLPIEMLYHACSGGRTEDAAEVFAASRPYLVSVASPGEEDCTGFAADTRFSRKEAAAMLCAAFPGCSVTADGLPGQLKLLSSTASGRISTVLVGNEAVSGRDFRQALGLRSTLCTWDADDEAITFHTLGYGHGVGMSQAGAQAMASGGRRYAEILAHYYPGTSLALLPAME